MADNPIKHSDIIQEGNPFDKTIKGLEALLKLFKKLDKELKTTAKELLKFTQKQNVATKEGKTNIQAAAKATKELTVKEKEALRVKKQLERAQVQLAQAGSKENLQLIKTKEALKLKNAEMRKAAKAMITGTKSTNKWGKALGSFQFKFNALGNIMANVTSFITRKFTRAIRGAVDVIVDFDSAMAQVRSITGATGKEFDKLRDSAKALGGATKFTASQVAGLQKEFAKLGFSTEEILNAQAATLDLAAATGADLARAAEVAGITIRQFGLRAAETKRVTDVMARSFTSSALDIEKFAEAMKFVGPAAKASGISIERTTAILGQLADAGISGSMAGTSLRQIMLALSGESGTFSEKIERAAESGLTLAGAADEVQKRAATALLVMAEGVDTIDDFTEALENAGGAAREMADIQLNTLAGQAAILKSAWEGLILEMSTTEDDLEGVKRGIGFITQSFNALTTFLKQDDLTLSQAFTIERLAAQITRELLSDVRITTGELKTGFQGLGETFKEMGTDIWEQLFPKESGENVVRTLENIDELVKSLDDTFKEQDQEAVDFGPFNLVISPEEFAKSEAALKKLAALNNVVIDDVVEGEGDKTQAVLQGLGSISDATNAFAEDNKAVTITTAIINGIASVIATWKNSGGFPLGIAAAAAQAAIIGKLISSMKSERFAEGGPILGDPHSRGGVNVEAEGGEYIINKHSTAKYNDLVRAINENDQSGIANAALQNSAFHEVWGRRKAQNNILVQNDPNIRRMREIMENTPQFVPEGKRTERWPDGRTRIVNG